MTQRSRWPDAGVAFSTGAALVYGWSIFLDAPNKGWFWGVMVLVSIPYFLLWMEPWLPRPTGEHPDVDALLAELRARLYRPSGTGWPQ